MSGGLLRKLLAKGHAVSFERGRLVITPAGDQDVPPAWFEKNRSTIVSEVIRALEVNAFRYIDFSVGNFSSGRAAGLRVVFEHYLSGAPARVFFNAGITRVRTTATGKKGTRLPGRQFHPKRGSKFVQFWLRTGLAEPRYSSEYHECMGRLKSIVVTCACDENGRIEKDTLRPLSIRAGQIRDKILGSGYSWVSDGIPPGTYRDHFSGSKPLDTADLLGLQSESAAASASAKEVISITGGEVLPFPTITLINETTLGSRKLVEIDEHATVDPREESNEDWWASYDSADARRSGTIEGE